MFSQQFAWTNGGRICGALLGTVLLLAGCSIQSPLTTALPAPPPGAITNAALPVSVADLPAAAALRTASRFALVIGNGGYTTGAWLGLDAPRRDAQAMARALSMRGFTIIGGGAQEDVSARRTQQLIGSTIQAARSHPGAIVVVYFAGHGFADRGHNYLVPTDAPDRSAAASVSVGVLETAQQLHAAGAGLVAMFLDACRDYLPGRGSGLVDEATPDATFIGFAAQYGTSAQEAPAGTQGYYTAALLSSLDAGFDRLDDMHLAVSREVSLATGFGQTPVFREGDRMPDAPVRLAINDPQTAFALARTRNTGTAAVIAARCAAESDFRLLLSTPEFMTSLADRGLLAGPVYEPADLASIEQDCASAYSMGRREPAVLRGLALVQLLEEAAYHKPVYNASASEWTLLTQAAEQGDAVSNYVLGSITNAPIAQPTSTAKTRLIAAAERREAPITGLVGLMLADDSFGADFRHRALLLPDKPLGDRLIRSALMDGDPFMVGWALTMKWKGNLEFAGPPLRDGFNRAIRRGGGFGFYIPGTTVYETLFLLATMDALKDEDWGEFSRLMMQAAPFLGHSLKAIEAASGIHSPDPSHLFTIAACVMENGLDPQSQKPIPGITPSRNASMALFRYAAATGDRTAKIILAQEEVGHLSCPGSRNAN
jgi:Caspase domain